ncbi:MAG: hypothetical protein PHH28_06595 [Desulfuromonadaceae bacterium]|nr:hypothetical protein [Desulfuromonadaceae bacterium]
MPFNVNKNVQKLKESEVTIIRRSERINKLKNNFLISNAWKIIKQCNSKKSEPDRNLSTSGNLYIIYRHVYISDDVGRFPPKFRPDGFDYNKCFINLIETIENSKLRDRVNIIVFYNGTIDDLNKDKFMNVLNTTQIHIEVRLLEASSALQAVLVMMREVKNLSIMPNDILYLLENDYLHHEKWLEETFEIFDSKIKFDYISLYDHPDRYKYPSNYSNSVLYVTSNRHWTTAPSTCGTFLLKYEVFIRDYKYFYTYKNDIKVFTGLTKRLKRVLLTPIPGLSTHSMSEHLDPIQRFEAYFKKDN